MNFQRITVFSSILLRQVKYGGLNLSKVLSCLFIEKKVKVDLPTLILEIDYKCDRMNVWCINHFNVKMLESAML